MTDVVMSYGDNIEDTPDRIEFEELVSDLNILEATIKRMLARLDQLEDEVKEIKKWATT